MISGKQFRTDPYKDIMSYVSYRRICQLDSPEYAKALKESSVHAMNKWTIRQWRTEFFSLGEIQQIPAGGEIRCKIHDKRRQVFKDVDGTAWKRIGSARGDMRMKIPTEMINENAV